MDPPRQPTPTRARHIIRSGLEAAAERLPDGAVGRIGVVTLRMRAGAGPEDVARELVRAWRQQEGL